MVRFYLVLLGLLYIPATSLGVEPWIIDTHTHFKGEAQIAHERRTTRRVPQDTLGHVVKPPDFRPVAKRLGIQATVIIEAVQQDRPEFNDWALEQAKSDLVCGYVARGDLTSKGFDANYARYKRTGLMKGYRFRMEELRGYLSNPAARGRLSTLEKDGMVVDLLVDPEHAKDVTQLAREYPKLKIVINHCFRARMKRGVIGDDWRAAVRSTAKFPNVYCKMSSITNFSDTPPFGKPAPNDLAAYANILNACFDAYGEDRIIFGTNWGVCNHFGKVDDVVRLATEFLTSKGEGAMKKGMRLNAIRVYDIDRAHLTKPGVP